jgi:superfamily II DNA or RNA helicase
LAFLTETKVWTPSLMPRIFDNIDNQLLPTLKTTLAVSHRSDFCVGYFNLRGWRQLDEHIESWAGGENECCRLLVGMQKLPQQDIAGAYGIVRLDAELDNQTAIRLKKALAEQFRTQLTLGAPTDADEAGLRRLVAQIRAKKVIVKLHLRHTLHAKLYLLFRHDLISPTIGFLGSSNLTFAGLSKQGELNVDVMDHDACEKLARWFDDRWTDRWCLDISEEIAEIIDQSWARPEPIPPHHIYVKMAFHLSQEAREGIVRYGIPRDFGDELFEFQEKAVKIAAHHVQKRGGVLLADVVGLGKTLMATALARVLSDELVLETLVLCPLNLVKMWEDHCHEYRLPSSKVMSYSKVLQQLPDLRRYRLIILDESHNLRNREGKTYRAILEYIQKNDSKCILLSATPYNKDYLDLASQLRLFVPPDQELGIGPERLIQEVDRARFRGLYQCGANTLAAFEKSHYPDDWRDLMRLYMVRRTRGFIKANYAKTDLNNGRKYLEFKDGSRSYFPDRLPKKLPFVVNEKDPNDEYARLYASPVVDIVNGLSLPRYGLGNSLLEKPAITATIGEEEIMANLSAAGTRLMGFCRSNLFKRLESSGHSFLLSVERHILRNFIFLHAIENDLEIPIGTQDSGLLDTTTSDEDAVVADVDEMKITQSHLRSPIAFQTRAAEIYALYLNSFRSRFQWIRPGFFKPQLRSDLLADAKALMQIFDRCAVWDPKKDSKLQALIKLVGEKHKSEKILIFSQFSDTVHYLSQKLQAEGIKRVAAATGESENVTDLAYRFSPQSNKKTILPEQELRVLVATDVLSEGQNLQDAFIIVNFDLPWTIIRLIQRAGRVDRIGQKSDKILCYSFLPADGIETIIRLRAKVRARLHANAEVVGTDESFFDDDRHNQAVNDLYHEKAGLLDGEDDSEVDLVSYAYQIWQDAISANPALKKTIEDMANVVYTAKQHDHAEPSTQGALVYLRTASGTDSLAWVDAQGKRVTDSPFRILSAARCLPETLAVPRLPNHNELVEAAVKELAAEDKIVGGGLGSASGARYRTYERLKRYTLEVKGTLFDTLPLQRTLEDIYRYPLRSAATDILNRHMKTDCTDQTLAELAMGLRETGRLSIVEGDDDQEAVAQIICSLGLVEE